MRCNASFACLYFLARRFGIPISSRQQHLIWAAQKQLYWRRRLQRVAVAIRTAYPQGSFSHISKLFLLIVVFNLVDTYYYIDPWSHRNNNLKFKIQLRYEKKLSFIRKRSLMTDDESGLNSAKHQRLSVGADDEDFDKTIAEIVAVIENENQMLGEVSLHRFTNRFGSHWQVFK